MKICYFGDFDPDYARSRVIIKGLCENGVEVLLCDDRSKGLSKYFRLWRLHKLLRGDYDLLIVGYSDSRWITPFARLISRKRIVWDGFYSIYDSWVFDRKLVSSSSLKAKYYWLMDWLNCRLADVILTDTNQHIEYFNKTFRAPREKFIRMLVGTDESLFNDHGRPKAHKDFLVHFHGNFVPLQGAKYIIKAMNILRDEAITLRIIGRGQDYETTRTLAESYDLHDIIWIDKVPYADLADYMADADICLGIFGETTKASRVIPNKVYEALAVGRAIITGNTPAIRELLTDREDVLLCRNADPKDLARKILELKNDKNLRESIASRGFLIYNNKASSKIIGQELSRYLNQFI